MSITIKRAYDTAEASDRCRILVDRVWPRGMSKEHARVDLWAKDAAPSTALRKWFGHDPVHKGLSPSGKKHLLKCVYVKYIRIFKLLLKISADAILLIQYALMRS